MSLLKCGFRPFDPGIINTAVCRGLTPRFVLKRHKSFDRRAESEIRFAFLGANASEWGLVLKLKIFTYLFEQ